MKTTGLTIEQVERERRACYGRYHEDINDYDVITEPVEYEQCDFCGLYFEPEEIQTENSALSFKYCPSCAKYACNDLETDDPEIDDRLEIAALFSELDRNEKRIDFHINELRKIS